MSHDRLYASIFQLTTGSYYAKINHFNMVLLFYLGSINRCLVMVMVMVIESDVNKQIRCRLMFMHCNVILLE